VTRDALSTSASAARCGFARGVRSRVERSARLLRPQRRIAIPRTDQRVGSSHAGGNCVGSSAAGANARRPSESPDHEEAPDLKVRAFAAFRPCHASFSLALAGPPGQDDSRGIPSRARRAQFSALGDDTAARCQSPLSDRRAHRPSQKSLLANDIAEPAPSRCREIASAARLRAEGDQVHAPTDHSASARAHSVITMPSNPATLVTPTHAIPVL